ncbi:cell division FtsK/SpoIIIE [Pseudonocardia sp. Ae168_Ps1]|uniref:FtsK/SpoIIIE domain-containing protein n=1 Tax=unclassified Pseudonocardia TaxID=2619320 RepID=UPI00094ACA4A|nr:MULTISPECIES: FtsK/SpoIIIE domain-containing protein [unclassified Pseudonocardia]OLL74909.1 cell division FtsK/SpoIIIE [Pseudonocardia sp. Ae150A_Ps1]OLL80900.1 cell division FtsK/SpoIIIE [Pseudonocardia sp. Ae168_Ps1]OLL84981.1 cell division FtsK/SpoIIIE [Pseudonocardia sp. Ae263_Ps1]OLL95002.1 cell division FtsK/SpoIIIE [Pseudonocardia sp. Ae356_Ps1]
MTKRSSSATRINGPARTQSGRATRAPGREFQAAAWLAHHPGFLAAPLALLGLAVVLGPIVTGAVVGALVLGVVVWGRAHPATFDRFAAPMLRATWRRWTVYRGRRWARLMADCGLTREHRHTGDQLVPRVLRVRSSSPTIDTVYVRMVRGQDVAYWQERASVVYEALIAHRVAITRHRPGVVAIVIEWELPFTRTIPAPDIPETAEDVDLGAVEIGDNERGEAFTAPVIGGHRLVAGASGAGKGSVLWSTLRGVGPCIRDGVVRVWMVDLKGGVETEQGAPLFHRYATDMAQALDLLTEFRDAMRDWQDDMREQNIRAATPSVATPVELLVIDEMAMLTAYGDRSSVRTALGLLAEVMTQGRASLFSVHGYLQEPSKDVVDVRELFTQRICLGVTAASHVDMVLGEGARERGALADEIPGDARHAGIGFVIDRGSRLPVRFRAAYVSDDDITELVARCTPPPDADVITIDGRDVA